MNRQQRRAAARKKLVVPMVRIGDLTMGEAEVVAEALDQYALTLEEDTDPASQQVWAIGRARAIRDMVQAGIDGRPTYDEHNDREQPHETSG